MTKPHSYKYLIYSSLFVLTTASAHSALIGYWNFDGDTLVETSGFKAAGTHDGEAVGTVAYTAGPSGFGRALDLGGAYFTKPGFLLELPCRSGFIIG